MDTLSGKARITSILGRFSGAVLLRAVWAAIALCCGMAGVARAEGNGRLFLVNPLNGTYISAGVDQYGDFDFKGSGSYSYLVGAFELFATPSAVVAYRPGIGGAAAFLIDGRGSATIAPFAAGFSAHWSIIKGFGNYLFFYGISGTPVGAIVAVNPDGTFHQTFSSYNFSTWTDVEATDNYLFFYNSSSGETAVGTIGADGAFTQSGTKASPYLPSGYTLVASIGDNILLYDYHTGNWESGSILYTGSSNQDSYVLRTRQVAGSSQSHVLPTNLFESVSNNGHLMLYSSTSGQGVIGHFDLFGAFTVDRTITLPRYYTSLISCGQYLFFYGLGTGTFQTGYFTADGNFQSRQSGFTIGIDYYGVAATKN